MTDVLDSSRLSWFFVGPRTNFLVFRVQLIDSDSRVGRGRLRSRGSRIFRFPSSPCTAHLVFLWFVSSENRAFGCARNLPFSFVLYQEPVHFAVELLGAYLWPHKFERALRADPFPVCFIAFSSKWLIKNLPTGHQLPKMALL